MKVIIFGASGSLGSHLVQQCLEKGLHVITFTRSPQKFKSVSSDRLSILHGDVFNQADVENAIKDIHAVFCTLGDGAKGKVRSKGTENIIAAMEKFGVSRFICQTTLGAGESWHNLNFFWKFIMFGFLLKKAFKDYIQQEKLIMSSNLDFTIVRPSAFTDEPITNEFKIGFSSNEKNLKLKISKADIAHFMIAQLYTDEFIRKTVSIST